MAEYIQTRLTNPSTPKKKRSSMARKRKSTRRRRKSARPVKVKMAGTRRRKSTRRRKKNPSRRRRTTKRASTRRRTTARRRNPTRRRRRTASRRRKNPAFDWQGTLVVFAGVAAGAFASDYVNDGMNKLFSNITQNNANAAPMLGALKLAGSFGLLGLAKMYEQQMPRTYGGVQLPVDEAVIAATAVSIKSGIELLMGGERAQAELAASQAAGTGRRMHGRRRRRMRGTIISSPELATQLRMGATHQLSTSGQMRGSLDVYPTEQNALLRMQGTGSGLKRSRSRVI